MVSAKSEQLFRYLEPTLELGRVTINFCLRLLQSVIEETLSILHVILLCDVGLLLASAPCPYDVL